MKSISYAFLLIFVSISLSARGRLKENADFTMKCQSQKSGLITLAYSADQVRSQETAQLTVDGTEHAPNMDKTFFSHAVSSYLNPITGQLQYTYHGNIQFQSRDASTYARARFFLDQNLKKGITPAKLYSKNKKMKVNVSLSLRKNKEWETFKGKCSLTYNKL